ncbi:MAG: glycosyltransferase family 2 protein [Marinilabiliaceae bacterium]|nr:glycosyltransferase family 2 protein [Marinilabiliaceae bacterium]
MEKENNTQPKTISVVILNWNTQNLLQKFLPVVIKNSNFPNVEIIVADNGSTDNSVEWIQHNFPQVKIIKFPVNYGFSEGYNRALASITSDFSVLLNSDVAPCNEWLEPLLEIMTDNSKVAAVVPKIKDYNSPTMFEYAGAAGGFIDRFGYTFCRGRIFDVLEKDEGQYDKEKQIFWGSGAALMVNTELFNSTGGLDKDFFAHMEEIDWCWRMKNMGYEIIFTPKSEVFHLGGGTLPYNNANKSFLNYRNNLFLLIKNRHGLKGWIIIWIRMILDNISLIKFLFSGNFLVVKSIILAHFAFLKKMPIFIKKRKILRYSLLKKEHAEIYKGSIVFDFFIRKKKRFKEIKF